MEEIRTNRKLIMSSFFGNLGTDLYLKGKVDDSKIFLNEAYKLGPSIKQVANNFGYIKLLNLEFDEATNIFGEIMERSTLEQYNYVLSLICSGQVEKAANELEILESMTEDLSPSVLLVPTVEPDGEVRLIEENYSESKTDPRVAVIKILREIITKKVSE